MSPLVASPNRGYADWQRVDNWDTPLVWDVVQPSTTITIRSPVIDVSRFGYVAGRMFTTTFASSVAFVWYSDPTKAQIVGERDLLLWGGVLNPANLRIPNLGPFLQITVSSPDGANYDFQGHLFLTNRYHPLEFIPQSPVVMEGESVPAAVGVAVTIQPFDYYAGPVFIDLDTSFGTSFLQLFRIVTATVSRDFFEMSKASAGLQTASCIIPPGGWNCTVINNSPGAGTFNLSIVPSMSGSS